MTIAADDDDDFLWADVAGRAFKPADRRFATPGELARYIDPRTVTTGALDLIDAALAKLAGTPDGRLIITMPPQEGKSVRVGQVFPVWYLLDHRDARVVVASYASGLSTRNGRAIRRMVTQTPSLGIRIARDNGAVGDWTIENHDGGVLSVGLTGGLTGRPADLMVIDDPIKDQQQADSETYRENVWDWWQTVASARLAPGAPVVVILTRWHHDDFAGRLIAEDDSEWVVLNIPAKADHRPELGEVDVLGREPGQYMASARVRSLENWQRRERTAGPRAWQALYQGRPSPDAGNVFRTEWWRYFEQPMWTVLDDGRHVVHVPNEDAELCQSWDMTFKDTLGSDYVVGQVWLRIGVRAYLLDQVRGRWTFAETCLQLKALSTKWPQAVAKLIEDKANGPAVINSLNAQIPGLIPVEPEGSKYARASAISPFAQAGNIWLPDPLLAPWLGEFLEEHKGFPTWAHDDQVDAHSQAVHRLLLVPLLAGDRDMDDDLDEFDADYEAAGISPY